MNYNKTINSILQRSSCRLIRAASPIASSGMGSDMYDPFHACLKSHYLVSETFESKSLVKVPKEKPFLRCDEPT